MTPKETRIENLRFISLGGDGGKRQRLPVDSLLLPQRQAPLLLLVRPHRLYRYKGPDRLRLSYRASEALLLLLSRPLLADLLLLLVGRGGHEGTSAVERDPSAVAPLFGRVAAKVAEVVGYRHLEPLDLSDHRS